MHGVECSSRVSACVCRQPVIVCVGTTVPHRGRTVRARQCMDPAEKEVNQHKCSGARSLLARHEGSRRHPLLRPSREQKSGDRGNRTPVNRVTSGHTNPCAISPQLRNASQAHIMKISTNLPPNSTPCHGAAPTDRSAPEIETKARTTTKGGGEETPHRPHRRPHHRTKLETPKAEREHHTQQQTRGGQTAKTKQDTHQRRGREQRESSLHEGQEGERGLKVVHSSAKM
jgi:hypothetical protein